VNVQCSLSPPSKPRLRCPRARHRAPKCSPGAAALAPHCSGCVFTVCVHSLLCVCSRCVCVHGVCVFTVCVHVGWVNCRALIPSMGHHTWPNVTSQQCKTTYFINYKALVNQSTNKMFELKNLDFKE